MYDMRGLAWKLSRTWFQRQYRPHEHADTHACDLPWWYAGDTCQSTDPRIFAIPVFAGEACKAFRIGIIKVARDPLHGAVVFVVLKKNGWRLKIPGYDYGLMSVSAMRKASRNVNEFLNLRSRQGLLRIFVLESKALSSFWKCGILWKTYRSSDMEFRGTPFH